MYMNKPREGSKITSMYIKNTKSWIFYSFPVQKNTHYMMIFDAFVILTCLASLILCTRSVIKGIRLQRVSFKCVSVALNCYTL